MCVCVSLSFCSTCANASENMHAQYSCDVLDLDEIFMGCSAAKQGFLDHKAHQLVFYVCIPLCCRSVPATHLQFEARYCGQWEMFSFQKLWAAPTACKNVPKLLWNDCAASMRGNIPWISIDSPVRSMAGSSADSLCMQL